MSAPLDDTDYSRVAIAAADCVLSVRSERIRKAQAGNADSASVGIPWRRFLAMVDAIETANPGWIDRARLLTKDKS